MCVNLYVNVSVSLRITINSRKDRFFRYETTYEGLQISLKKNSEVRFEERLYSILHAFRITNRNLKFGNIFISYSKISHAIVSIIITVFFYNLRSHGRFLEPFSSPKRPYYIKYDFGIKNSFMLFFICTKEYCFQSFIFQ